MIADRLHKKEKLVERDDGRLTTPRLGGFTKFLHLNTINLRGYWAHEKDNLPIHTSKRSIAITVERSFDSYHYQL